MRFAIRRTIIQHIVQFFVVQFFHPLSNDKIQLLGDMVKNICFNNARDYFAIELN